MSQKYQPINCHFYDELELLAIRQKHCSILYLDETGNQLEKSAVIIDFKIIAAAEYMLLKDGDKIRLDRLVAVDGKVLEGFCKI